MTFIITLPNLCTNGYSILATVDANDDGDEPYTPFDDDDDNMNPPSYTGTPIVKPQSNDLESEMEILTRQIEQRQMEIQTLAKQKAMELNEAQAMRIYENISVPHNLSEILSTITKNQPSESKSIDLDDDDDEYVPTAMGSGSYRATSSSYSAMSQNSSTTIVNSMMDIDERIAMFQGTGPAMTIAPVDDQPSRTEPGLLANMTDADLMKLVPDGALEPPPAPKISQPAIPGLDGDDYEME